MKQLSVCGPELLGEIGIYRIQDMEFRVKVMDVRKFNGRTVMLVIPCDGKGMSWVDARKISFKTQNLSELGMHQ
jgi:hypothetical protein